MARFVALLRAVNVGSTRLAMDDLRSLVAGLGFGDVRTSGNTGNVVFDTDATAGEASDAIETALEGRYGRRIPVIIRLPSELGDAADRALAWAPPDATSKSLQIGYCRDTPPADCLDAVPFDRVEPDTAHLDGRELLLNYPNGQGRSKMTGTWLMRFVPTDLTIRSIGVSQKLATLGRQP